MKKILLPCLGAFLALSMVTPAQARYGAPWVSTVVSSEGQGPASEVRIQADHNSDRVVLTFVTSTRWWGHHKLVFHGTRGGVRWDARYYLMTTDGRVRITKQMESDRGFVLGRGPFADVEIRLVVVSHTGSRWGVFYDRTFTVRAGMSSPPTHDSAVAYLWAP